MAKGSAVDLTGRRFGRLVVQSRHYSIGPRQNRGALWLCHCDCGEVRIVRSDALQSGKTVSCTCQKRDRVTTHGLSRMADGKKTPEFEVWRGIRRRCCDPSQIGFARYGGRGIKICDRWQNDYAAFLNDMGKRPSAKHSIERIDNDGDYSPENCRWATSTEQAQNRRSTRLFEFSGQAKCISQWAREFGLNKTTLRRRLDRGVPMPQALSQPCASPVQRDDGK